MKRPIFALVALVALLAGSVLPAGATGALPAPAASAAGAPAAGVIPDHYIVVLRPGNDPRAVSSRAGATPRHLYTQRLLGFAARLDATQLRALGADPAVEQIVPDRRSVADQLTIGTTQAMDASGDPWGLDRIDQKSLPLSGT